VVQLDMSVMRILTIAVTLLGLMVIPGLACDHIPPLAVALDKLLPQSTLSETDLAKIKELQAQIKTLAATGKIKEARETETQAMRILGYKKVWLKCGPGTFQWVKL
jgi:hypothetical protein